MRQIRSDDMDITLTFEEATSLVAFIKMHERENIPDDVWDLCMKIQDELDIY